MKLCGLVQNGHFLREHRRRRLVVLHPLSSDPGSCISRRRWWPWRSWASSRSPQVAALLADEDFDERSYKRRISTFLNVVVLGSVVSSFKPQLIPFLNPLQAVKSLQAIIDYVLEPPIGRQVPSNAWWSPSWILSRQLRPSNPNWSPSWT